MKTLILSLGLLLACAARSYAGAWDVCYNPPLLTSGRAATVTAQVFPAGTIPAGLAPVNCDLITATPIGTLFVVGSIVTGLPYTETPDFLAGTLYFRISGGVKLVLVGTMKLGADRSYDLPITAAVGLEPTAGVATVTNLDPSGSAFTIVY